MQYADFEMRCFGWLYWADQCCGLPDDEDIGYEAALSAAREWQAEEKSGSGWIMMNSSFCEDQNNWKPILLS